MKSKRAFSVWNNNIFSQPDEWKDEGDNTYSITFMPRDTSELGVSLKEEGRNYWNHVVVYDIEQPSQADWKNVEKYYPLCLPEIKNVKNLNKDNWRNVGINGHQLLKHIRNGNVKELPVIYDGKGQRYTIIDFPMNKYLKAGQPYTFSFRPQIGIRWALVNNNQWYQDWNMLPDGALSMSLTPSAGPLFLYVQLKEGDSYWTCIGYEVR